MGETPRVLSLLTELSSQHEELSNAEKSEYAAIRIRKYIAYVRDGRTSPGHHELEDWMLRNRRTAIQQAVYGSPDKEAIAVFERILDGQPESSRSLYERAILAKYAPRTG
jgi:hypothetical protein